LSNRSVLLHTKPRVFVEDIDIDTRVINEKGIIKYAIKIEGLNDKEIPFCQVNLLDVDDQYVIDEPSTGTQGVLKVASPRLWWPRSMNSNPGYMYTLEVVL
jgi:beta-glucuronidase